MTALQTKYFLLIHSYAFSFLFIQFSLFLICQTRVYLHYILKLESHIKICELLTDTLWNGNSHQWRNNTANNVIKSDTFCTANSHCWRNKRHLNMKLIYCRWMLMPVTITLWQNKIPYAKTEQETLINSAANAYLFSYTVVFMYVVILHVISQIRITSFHIFSFMGHYWKILPPHHRWSLWNLQWSWDTVTVAGRS